jgi:FdhD protein
MHSIREFGIHRCQPASDSVSDLDRVAVEEPLEIVLSFRRKGALVRKPISITMRTPGADEALAAGFLFTEGMIQTQSAIESIERQPDSGDSVLVRLQEEIDLKRLDRHFYVSSSCGVCGKTSLEAIKMNRQVQLLLALPQHDAQFLVRLPDIVRGSQPIFQDTGGLHAAALFDENEQLIRVCEDIGRHNAVDKVIGAELLAGRSDFSRLLLFVSGRAGFELVQKSIMSGIPFLAAVGAPSSLSVELARRYDATLIGFLRENRFNLYAGPRRIVWAANSRLNTSVRSRQKKVVYQFDSGPPDSFEPHGKPNQAERQFDPKNPRSSAT